MKHFLVLVGVASGILLSSIATAKERLPVPDGPYLGQKPPGLTPEVFAPNLISLAGRYEGTIAFSPELNEVYFGANNDKGETHIYFSRRGAEGWSPIQQANFTKGEKAEEIHPFVSRDGRRIYFTGLNSDLSDTRIWYVNRFDDTWGNPVKLGSPINDQQVFYPNQGKNGGLYYFNLEQMKTFYARETQGQFSQIRQVSLPAGTHHAVAAPSEAYLIVNARNTSQGRKDNDLYVSFKNADGTWSNPIHLGNDINSARNEKGPSISHDGKYLFFGRDEADGNANIYWVSTKAITKLNPKR